MECLLAIDPGTTESGYCVMRTDDYYPVEFGKVGNEDLLSRFGEMIKSRCIKVCVIEMIQYYGKFMNAGQTTFDTCVWIGRFTQELVRMGISVEKIYRTTVKTHLTGLSNAKDGDVVTVIKDRFVPNAPNHGKGRKDSPTMFYNFAKDMWQAFAVGVTYIDKKQEHIFNSKKEIQS